MSEPAQILSGEHEVWCGDALDSEHAAAVMRGEFADLLCVDAPYSEKTHAGHDEGARTAERALSFSKSTDSPEARYAGRKAAEGWGGVRPLEYAHFTPADVAKFCEVWCPLTRGWFVTITDDQLAPAWADALRNHDRYVFAPLPFLETGSRVRMAGDGPSNWTCWMVVARPRTREFQAWGTLPGAYVQPAERLINSKGGSDRIVGGKPFRSMCAIVDDYSKRGDLVVDPCAGGGTTLMAARYMGRRARGMEQNQERAELSARMLGKAREQGVLFG